MSLRKANPSLGAVGNLKSQMEAEEEEKKTKGDSSGGGGLSTGATAGISIGVALLVGILCIIFFVSRRRKEGLLVNNDNSGYQSFKNT